MSLTARELNRHILNVRTHKVSRTGSLIGFINRVLRKPFSTMSNTFITNTQSRLAVALKNSRIHPSRDKVLTTQAIISKKLQSFNQAYFVSNRAFFYWEMLFIRSKLQWYRFI